MDSSAGAVGVVRPRYLATLPSVRRDLQGLWSLPEGQKVIRIASDVRIV